MRTPRFKAELKPKSALKNRLAYRMKFGPVLNMPEPEFARMVAEIENDPLMRRLLDSRSTFGRVISRKRFAQTRLSQSFYELNAQTLAAPHNIDVESLLQKHSGMIRLIQKIGRGNFERYFLYPDEPEPLATIAQACQITAAEAAQVQSMLQELAIHSEFFHPSTLPPEQTRYSLVATVEMEDGKPVLAFSSPHFARGAFIIHHDKLDAAKDLMSSADKKNLAALLAKIEQINFRQNTLQKVLEELLLKQRLYSQKGESAGVVLTQKDAAARLGVAPSSISRAIYAKTVVLPDGREMPIRDLFINKKKIARWRIQDYLESLPESEREKTSDNQLKEFLRRRYGSIVSRRSINQYRREIEKKKQQI